MNMYTFSYEDLEFPDSRSELKFTAIFNGCASINENLRFLQSAIEVGAILYFKIVNMEPKENILVAKIVAPVTSLRGLDKDLISLEKA